jgi:hypothetical protein
MIYFKSVCYVLREVINKSIHSILTISFEEILDPNCHECYLVGKSIYLALMVEGEI